MRLIEFCKANTMYIFNGRVGTDRYAGNFTTTKNSIIDYVIRSPFILSIIDGFKIALFDLMFSDIHCAIEFSLKQAILTHKEAKQTHIDVNSADIQMKQNPVYIWSQANRQPFIENINLTKVQAIISLLDNCNEDSQEIDINEIVLSINHIWQDSAGKNFNKRRAILSSENISIRKPVYNKWFNETCNTSRILYLRNKDAFRRNKLYVNKTNLIRSSKIYKKSISAAKLKARRQFEHDLRTDPRKYWKMLNNKSLKRNTIQVSMHEMVDHFKKTLNEASTSDRTDNLHDNIINVEDNPELDYTLSEGEIRKVIKSLKCNKACGSDAVLNEFIISTVDIFLPIYIRLFDYILQSGNLG